jgi:CubicO group peptidase (beta-lactamase class C family)
VRLITAATFGLFCLFGHARAAEIADRFPGAEWDHAMPAAAGWSADRLKAAEEWSGKIGSTAIIVVHHGAIVGEWGNTSAKTPLASVRKSLLSALYGIAVERGQINLNQNLAQLGIDDNEPSLSAEEKAATVRDLLQARSGVYHAALYETPGMAARAGRRATAIRRARSGTTTIGTSTRSVRFTSTRQSIRSSMRSTARSRGRSGCRTTHRATAPTSPARTRFIPPIRSR